MKYLLGLYFLMSNVSSYATCTSEVLDSQSMENDEYSNITGFKSCSVGGFITVGFKVDAGKITEAAIQTIYPVGGTSVMRNICDLTQTDEHIFQNLNLASDSDIHSVVNTERLFSDSHIVLELDGQEFPVRCL